MDKLSAELDYKQLCHNGDSFNEKEHRIIKESFEYIDFAHFELAAVELIKELQEYKRIEKNSQMHSIVFIPFGHLKRTLYMKNGRAKIQHYSKRYNLINRLCKNIPPHTNSEHAFLSLIRWVI